MRVIFIMMGCLLLAVSCRKAPDHLPAGKMEDILLDVQLAEVYSSMAVKDTTRKEPGVKNLDSLAVWYQSVFHHHGVSLEQFNSSVDWYRQHPDELDSIYTHVLLRLNTLGRPPAAGRILP